MSKFMKLLWICYWRICWIKVKDVLNNKIDGSESSTDKGVNIATEFNEFKDVLFNKKIIRHKMKRIQAKKHRVYTLAYFHKDS